MDPLIVVTYPEPVALEAKAIEHDGAPEGSVAVGYYYHDALIARSAVAPESMDAIRNILSVPVSVALAASVDPEGNIDGRVCLVLPINPEEVAHQEEEEPDEPWKASVPAPPPEIEQGYEEEDDERQARVVLLPIGNVVREARNRRHPDDIARDAREMLENLLAGRAQDAVAKAIDDLLNSL